MIPLSSGLMTLVLHNGGSNDVVCPPLAVEEMGETDATIRLMPGMDWHSHPSLLPPASSVL